jgi:hypothetical protein
MEFDENLCRLWNVSAALNAFSFRAMVSSGGQFVWATF